LWLRRGLVVAFACLAGCSLALTGPEPKLPKHKSPECDRTKALVGLDGVVAGVSALTGLALISDNQSAAAVPLVIGAVYTLAAVYGNNTVNDCRAAIAKYEDGQRVNDLAGMPESTLPGRANRAALKKKIDAHTGMPAEPPSDPYVEQTPVAPPPVAPPQVTAPVVAPKPTPPVPPSPPVKPPPPPPSDPWRDFWREVP
jgi:hypothetical protein